MKQLFIVTVYQVSNGNTLDERITNEEQLDTCLKNIEQSYPKAKYYVNLFKMCPNGYYVKGASVII